VQHAIKAQAEGKDLVVLAAMMDNPTAALVARADLPEIKSAADLKGKTLGVVALGSGHHMIGLAIAEAYGLRADDITFRNTGGISGWIPSMRAKRVDALIASEPTLSRLLDEGLGRILLDLHGRDETHKVFKGPHPTVAVIARRDYVAANPKVVQAVVSAHVRALQWIAAHKPNEIADALPDELKKQPGVDRILARVLPAVSAKGETSAEAITVTANWLKRMGEIPADAAIDPKKVVDDKFLR
jgi:NitT/TauT family transport system substrate-binding protein